MTAWASPDPATVNRPVTVREVDPWRARQKRYFEDHPKRCVICGATDAVHAHHRHYRDDRGSEQDRTLVALCARHHRQVHRWHDAIAPTVELIARQKNGRRKWHQVLTDKLPYRWLSSVTTVAIVVLTVGLWLRRPWVLVTVTVAVTVLVGVWLPALVAVGLAVKALREFTRKGK